MDLDEYVTGYVNRVARNIHHDQVRDYLRQAGWRKGEANAGVETWTKQFWDDPWDDPNTDPPTRDGTVTVPISTDYTPPPRLPNMPHTTLDTAGYDDLMARAVHELASHERRAELQIIREINNPGIINQSGHDLPVSQPLTNLLTSVMEGALSRTVSWHDMAEAARMLQPLMEDFAHHRVEQAAISTPPTAMAFGPSVAARLAAPRQRDHTADRRQSSTRPRDAAREAHNHVQER